MTRQIRCCVRSSVPLCLSLGVLLVGLALSEGRSTKDTAAVIFALAEHMEASGELHPDFEARVTVNGEVLKDVTMRGNALEVEPVVVDVPLTKIRGGANVIRIERQGSVGNLYYSATLGYYTSGESLGATGDSLRVTREYFRLVPKDEENLLEFVRVPLRGEVRSGEEIEVRLTLEADSEFDYLMLEDFFPAGCEVVEDKADLDQRYRYWWSYVSNREARDEKMVFFNQYVTTGKLSFVYTLRAETPGAFHVMPARATLMYEPEVMGTSKEEHVSIFD